MAEVVAVAYVVDSSLDLSLEWVQLQQEYILPMLHRLGSLYTPRCSFRLGFVTYGTSETRPTPLLERAFFGDASDVIKQLNANPASFSIGWTGTGESGGMAVLEGLVAALELFDALRESVQLAASFIFHVAAAPPDSAKKPLWNMSPSLDNISWGSLPSELKKREISYNSILLKQVPKLSEFYSLAAVGASQKPWFVVRPQHNLHLSGFPSSPPKGIKRPSETNVAPDRTDNKRKRVQSQSTQPSPPMSNPAPLPATTPVPSTSASTSAANLNPRNIAMLEQHVRQLKEHVTAKNNVLQAHKAAGRLAEAAALNQELAPLVARLKQMMSVLTKAQMFQARSQSLQSQSQPSGLNAGGDGQAAVSTQDPPEAKPGTAIQSSISLPQMSQAMPSSNPTMAANDMANYEPPAPPSVAIQPPPIAAQPAGPPASTSVPLQMSSMVEQHRNTPRPGAPPQLASTMPQNPSSMVGTTNPTRNNTVSFGPPVWEGIVTWGQGLSSIGRTMQAQAIFYTPQQGHADILRTLSWPTNLTLVASQAHACPIVVLQDWMRRHQNECAIIYVTQKTDGAGEQNLAELSKALEEKKIYAFASFIGPNGLPERRILLFPARTGHLAGAAFLTPGGMPDPPKPEIGGWVLAQLPPQLAVLLSKLPAQEVRTLETIAPEDRKAALQAIVTRHQQQLKLLQQQQQQHQAQWAQQQPQQTFPKEQAPQKMAPAKISPGPLALKSTAPKNSILLNPFINSIPPSIGQHLSNATGGGPSQPQLPNFLPGTDPNLLMQQPVMHRRTPSAGNMGQMSGMTAGVSFEMMQSFMQRNQEGAGGNPGPGLR